MNKAYNKRRTAIWFIMNALLDAPINERALGQALMSMYHVGYMDGFKEGQDRPYDN